MDVRHRRQLGSDRVLGTGACDVRARRRKPMKGFRVETALGWWRTAALRRAVGLLPLSSAKRLAKTPRRGSPKLTCTPPAEHSGASSHRKAAVRHHSGAVFRQNLDWQKDKVRRSARFAWRFKHDGLWEAYGIRRMTLVRRTTVARTPTRNRTNRQWPF